MIVDLAAQLAMDHLKKVGFDRLSESERILVTVWQFVAGVANHGFASYYGSRLGDLAHFAPTALRAIGAHELATIAAEANAQFGAGGPAPDPKARAEQLLRFDDKVHRRFTEFEERFFGSVEDAGELLERWFGRQTTLVQPVAEPGGNVSCGQRACVLFPRGIDYWRLPQPPKPDPVLWLGPMLRPRGIDYWRQPQTP